jgi:methionyl-tRNA synthetase
MNASIGQQGKPFYITTTLPYVNADPHVGHAMEFIRADIIARYKRLQGFDVFFNTGTDEHGVKILRKAEELGIEPKQYVDKYAEVFKSLKGVLGLSEVNFIRTTDEQHLVAAEHFWRLCHDNGFIYKKNYKNKYCVGCELEKTDSELVDGKCTIHNTPVELIDEENYFFKFSAFELKLKKLYMEKPDFVVPAFRFNEIRAFVERGLEDFSISRIKSKMSWGIPVPGDENHVMSVWFDALVSYLAAIGWPRDIEKFEKWWLETGGVVQYCGKDNLRQQSAMWQAMLMSVKFPPSKQIVVDGFVTGEGGIKMSKSLGNVVNPIEVVEQYGTDSLRYYMARELSSFEDGPFTLDRMKATYNANLANGLGNLVSRIMKMASANLPGPVAVGEVAFHPEYVMAMDFYNINKAADVVWKIMKETDHIIQEKKPFQIVKENKEEGVAMIIDLVKKLYEIAVHLSPILPQTAETIQMLIRENKMPEKPLFVRRD